MIKFEDIKPGSSAAMIAPLAAGMFVVLGLASAQQPAAPGAVGYEDSYQINVVGRLDLADSIVNITNPGFHLPATPFNGPFSGSAGYICANIYVFNPAELMVECCTCPVSRNGVQHLSVKADLTSNPIFPQALSSVTIKLVSTVPPGGANSPATCNAASLPSSTVALGANGGFASGMRAWATHVHSVSTSTSGTFRFGTETEFSKVPLADTERNLLSTTCAFIQGNQSGSGICKMCQQGAQ